MEKWILIILSIVMNSGPVLARLPTAKVTFRVIDQQGMPVENARIQAGFIEASGRSVKGVTDTNGVFVAKDISSGGAACFADKDGFYRGGGGIEFESRNKFLNRLKPWNPTVEVVMKEVRNPVLMVEKHQRLKFSVFEKPVGFDLENGEWVSPYGSGIHSDFIITASTMTNVLKGTMYQITFPNEYDGIMEYPFDPEDQSYFKWPYMAPQDGYEASLMKYAKVYEKTVDYSKLYPNNSYIEVIKVPEYNTKKDNEINYIFRVRSQVDGDGKLIRACYGKIKGEISVGYSGSMSFHYWFNPNWTRNLEDDPKRNIQMD